MKRIFHCILILLYLLCLCTSAWAADEDAANGLAADTLMVKVGYFGGPYYEKAVFSLEELWAMDVVYADYTFIDNMPGVVIDHVAGVRLSDLMDAAGIDIGSVESFYFWTRDKQSDYYTSYSKAALIDTPRYCYYSLPDNWDEDKGAGNELATSFGEPVDCLIALADDWNRCIAGASFGSDYSSLDTDTRFRLIFGQTNGWERTASRSARWIHEIVVELGGAPTLTLDDSVLEGEVGSVLRTEAGITADNTVLENEGIHWSSSDASVAAVDEHGNITLHAVGAAVITAEFAGVTATLAVTALPGDGGTMTLPTDSGTSDADAQIAELIQNAAPSSEETEFSDTMPIVEPIQNADPSTKEIEFSDTMPIQPQIETETEVGGIQNWRVYEMSESASELGNIETDVSLLPVAVAVAILLFGAAGFALKFYRDIRGKKTC